MAEAVAEKYPDGLSVPEDSATKEVIVKTAQFVAKNGRDFEQRIMSNSSGNSKFNFLLATNEYHAFYNYKLKEFVTAVAPEQVALLEKAPPQKLIRFVRPGLVRPDSLPEDPAAPDRFLVRPKMAVMMQDIETIKVAAQFTARYGLRFLESLLAREAKNPLFEFLRPTSQLHPYFQSMVNAYAFIISPPEEMLRDMILDTKDSQRIYHRVLHKLEWNDIEDERKAKEEAESNEKTEDEAALDDTTREGMDADAEARAAAEREAFSAKSRELEERRIQEEAEKQRIVIDKQQETLPIVKGYKQEPVRAPMPKTAEADIQICPYCGSKVAATDMAEHIRIELLDPRWAEQRKTAMEKQQRAKVALANEADMSRYLAAFASRRGDIFETNAPNAGEISAEPVSLSSSNKRPAMDSMPIAPMSYPIPQSGPFSDDPKRPRIDIVNLPIAMAPVSAPVVPMVPMAGVVMPPMPVTMVPTVQLPPQPPKYLAQLLPEEVFNSGRAPFGLFNVRISQESDAMDEVGSIVSVEANYSDSIAALKDKIGRTLGGISVNRINLKYADPTEIGQFQDTLSVSYYNITPERLLEVSIRDKRKKK